MVYAGFDSNCPEGTVPIRIEQIQSSQDWRPGLARSAAAADVNHNGLVCATVRGSQDNPGYGVTFVDDIPIGEETASVADDLGS